jgi:hypothetical protein
MGVRRARLSVQVIAVVEQDDQPEVGDRCEDRRPIAEDRTHGAAPHRQPAPVPGFRPEVGGQQDVTVDR